MAKNVSESKIAILFNSGGEGVLDIFEPFSVNATGKTDLSLVLRKCCPFLSQVHNVTFERYFLLTRIQLEFVSFDHLMASLKLIYISVLDAPIFYTK